MNPGKKLQVKDPLANADSDDVLDRFEAHLAFLTYSSETDAASVLTPRMPHPTGSQPAVPKSADDILDLKDK
jgi:choline/glycine/proline betaine transport protein